MLSSICLNLGGFLKRPEIYLAIPPSTMMAIIIVKIMVELLSFSARSCGQADQAGTFQ